MQSSRSRLIASLQIIKMLTFVSSWLVLGLAKRTAVVSAQRLPVASCCFLTTPITRRSYQRIKRSATTTNFIHSNQWRNVQSTSCATDSQTQNEGKQEVASTIVSQEEQTWLVVGDGDLSYGAALAETLLKDEHGSASLNNQNNIRLIASVLEDQSTHQAVYRNSRINTQRILGPATTVTQEQMDDEDVNNDDETSNDDSNNRVLFSVDATKLEHFFPLQSLDRIIFNFPHWRGKNNNRYNRKLLDDFLRSASRVLKRDDENFDNRSSSNSSRRGEIHVALGEKQGGADAESLVEWRGSWMAPAFAAEHGLVLRRLEPFAARYDRSAHRGVDRPFPIGKRPLTYVFGWPSSRSSRSETNNNNDDDNENDDPRLKIAFRHELRLVMDPSKLSQCDFTQEDLEHSDVVPELVRQVTPLGIDCEVPLCALILPQKKAHPLLVFLVVYRSTLQRPLTRSAADRIRSDLEEAATERLGLDIAKRDRMVSKPFPYSILNTLIKDF